MITADRKDALLRIDNLTDAAFHCQPAVEKVFKSFLMWHSVPFRKTHSLEKLGEQCLDVDSTLRELIDCAVPLTEYAWKFRYPGDPEEPSFDEAKEALQIAREVYEAVLGLLPADVRPS
jgi:HEPN domain-containing protein